MSLSSLIAQLDSIKVELKPEEKTSKAVDEPIMIPLETSEFTLSLADPKLNLAESGWYLGTCEEGAVMANVDSEEITDAIWSTPSYVGSSAYIMAAAPSVGTKEDLQFRKGMFTFSDDFLKMDPDLVQQIFAKVIPLKVEYDYAQEKFLVTALSYEFALIHDSIIPTYMVTITTSTCDSPKVSFSRYS